MADKKTKMLQMATFEGQDAADVALSFVHASVLTYVLTLDGQISEESEMVESLFNCANHFSGVFMEVVEEATKDIPKPMRKPVERMNMNHIHTASQKKFSVLLEDMKEIAKGFADEKRKAN